MKRMILISGAGSGIGRAISTMMADAGYPLILLGRNRHALEETLSLLETPANHTIMTADLRDAQSIQTGLQDIAPVLYGIVANAGLGGENHYGVNDRWHDIIETNLTGTYQLVQESLPYFAAKNEGYRHIVLIASILARLGVPGYSAYCASKAGLLGLMRSWAVELAPKNILVNAICPGWVNTQMAVQGLQSFAQATEQAYEMVYQEQMAQVLLGKMSEPNEVARLTSFLLGQDQTSITGQTLDINNGALMPA